MKLPPIEYVSPKTIKRACQLLKEHKGRALVIAGGTDLVIALKHRLKSPQALIDLRTIPKLDRIEYSAKSGLKIGPLVTLRHLAWHPAVSEDYPMLAQAALSVGTPQLQAMGTVGGNLCQDNLCLYYNRSPLFRQMDEPCHKLGGKVCYAVPRSKTCWATYSGDLAPALLVLGAKIKITDSIGERVWPLKKLYSGDGKKPNLLKPGQILTEIQVPPSLPFSRGVYLKLRVRKAIDYPLLGVAAHVTMGNGSAICENAALAMTGVERRPLMIEEAGRFKGAKITDQDVDELAEVAYKQAHPLSNIGELTPRYRKDMVKVYVKEAFQQILRGLDRQGGAA
jgi:4-hydroxybenzoyl-CoA reductase subunit beta